MGAKKPLELAGRCYRRGELSGSWGRGTAHGVCLLLSYNMPFRFFNARTFTLTEAGLAG